MLRHLLLLGLLVMVGACQAPMQSGFQCVVEPGFVDAENSFSWRAKQGLAHDGLDLQDDTGYVGPIIQSALKKAVQAELGGKGFAFVDQPSADLQVMLTLRTRRELVSFTTGSSPCEDVDCWERIDPGAGTRMDIRTVGFLAADIYYRDEPIWRGWVETNLYPKDRDASADVIARAVPKLFESFPP